MRAADGSEALAVLKQPKRLALLAYLAASTPHRFHRRDSLVALFWPELGPAQARRALRRAVYYLRQALGPDAVTSRGDELGTSPEVVSSDVVAFQAAIDGGSLAAAMALYRGDFLEGLFVSSAPDVERWLDDERRRLRDLAVRAAWALSRRADGTGDASEAARWAQRALELTPDDEPGLRRLLRLLDRSGGRAAALQAYDAFVERLATELGLEPDPETVAVVASIRSRREAVPQSDDTRRRPPSPNLVAVLPFTVRGPDELQYLREGMVDLLSSKLDGAGDLRTVDARSLLRHLESLGAGTVDAHEARAVGERFGAGWCLLGSVVATGARLHVSVTLCQAEGDREIKADVGDYGEAEIFRAVDEIARHILAQWSTSYGGMMARLAAVTTESLDALKAYLIGERAYRAGRYADAIGAYDDSVREDPTFALGHLRLAAAYAARGAAQAALEPATSAWEHRHRLNPRLKLLVEAQAAALRGAATTAEDLSRSVTQQMPTSVDAWFLLGETLFRFNPNRGRSVLEARRALEQTLQLDPRHVGALIDLVRLAALGRHDHYLSHLLERLAAAQPDADLALGARAIGAFALEDGDARQAEVVRLRQDPPALAAAAGEVAVYVGDLRSAGDLARQLLEVAPSAAYRAHAHLLLAYFAVASRNLDDAFDQFDRVERADRATGLLHRALVLAQHPIDAPDTAIEACHRATEQWQPTAPRAPSHEMLPLTAHDSLHAPLRQYVLGLLCGRMGEREVALAHADRCAEAAGDAVLLTELATGVRARVALQTGDADRAVTLTESVTGEDPWPLLVASPFYGRVAERFLRAEALEAAGRSADAVGWFESLAQRSPFELMLLPAAAERAERIRRSRPSLGGR